MNSDEEIGILIRELGTFFRGLWVYSMMDRPKEFSASVIVHGELYDTYGYTTPNKALGEAKSIVQKLK